MHSDDNLRVSFKYGYGIWRLTFQRRIFHHYLPNTQGLLYVVDSNDRRRLGESRDFLNEILDHKVFKEQHPVVLIIANKRDIEGCMSLEEIRQGLEIHKQEQEFKISMYTMMMTWRSSPQYCFLVREIHHHNSALMGFINPSKLLNR